MRVRAMLLASVAIAAIVPYGNTLTGLIPDLFAGMDVVSREFVGFIPAVNRNTSSERAAVGENVSYPISPQLVTANIAPAMTIPEPTDLTVGVGSLQITKAKAVNFGWVGEDQKGLNNGPGYLTVQADLFAQALRVLVNEMETDVATAAYGAAAGAYGVPGTTPFGTNTGEAAQMRKILDDRGASPSDRSMIIDTTTGASLRTLTQLTKVNEAGTSMTLRDGQLLDLSGLSIKESAQMPASHTKGTAASATTDTTGYAVGTTTINLASAGTGTFVANDVVTFTGDPNKYVLSAGDTDTSNGGTIVLRAPGLLKALPASAVNITLSNTYSVSGIAFPRYAIQLVCRAPALPQEGDAAVDSMMITDPRSGMTFEIRVYAGYRKIRYEVGLAWGVKATKGSHIALLMG